MTICRKASVFIAVLLAVLTVLSACGPGSGQTNAGSSSIPREVSGGTQEPGSSAASSSVSSAEQKAESGTKQTIWSLLGSDAQTFAEAFSAENCDSLEYTFYGEGGATVSRTEDPELIRDVFDALCALSVVEETNTMADDFDDVFCFHSGSDTLTVRFNMHNLDVGGSYYILENDGALWQAADRIAESMSPDNPEPVYETIVSAALNFSFECNTAYENEENEDGRISIYLQSGIDSHPYVRVDRIKDGTDAKSYLDKTAEEIRSHYSGLMLSESTENEMIRIDGRDFFRYQAAFYMDDLEMAFTGYTEDYEDGSVLFYCALCEKKYEDTASDVLSTAISTVWVGELEEPEDTAAPKTGKPQKAGRWTYTETPLDNGDIEYCFDDALILTIPKDWIDKVLWACEDDYFDFYHAASYKAYAEQDLWGGLLFSLAYYPDSSYEALPAYQYLGRAENGGSYIMVFPTDVQAYTEDEEIRNEWQELYESISYVLDHSYSMIFQ